MTDLQLLGRKSLTQELESCDKCLHTRCRHLHDHAGKPCPMPDTCDACPQLARIDEVIRKGQEALASLMKQRTIIKQKINSRHDRMIRRLPVEVVSIIFIFYAQEGRSFLYESLISEKKVLTRPSLFLGSVCKLWRDITLTIPQLWTEVNIDFCQDIDRTRVIKNWLGRSGGLPLNMKFNCGNDNVLPDLEPFFEILRPHASRWRHVDMSLPPRVIYGLLNGLELDPGTTVLRMVGTGSDSGPGQSQQPVLMVVPFRPINLVLENYCPSDSILRWGMLTSVNVKSINVDALVHIVTFGINIHVLTVDKIRNNGGDYPLPAFPIFNDSVHRLVIDAHPPEREFLQYVTFPALQDFDYKFNVEEPAERRTALDVLIVFLRRTAPPLDTFLFIYIVKRDFAAMPEWRDQWNTLPQITDLKLVCLGDNIEDENYELEPDEDTTLFIESFFQGLAHDLTTVALPNLRSLTLRTVLLSQETWSIIGKIFLPTQRSGPADVDSISVSALNLGGQDANPHLMNLGNEPKRPLNNMIINLFLRYGDDEMEEETYMHFTKLQRSGLLKLAVTHADSGMDLLALWSEQYDFENVSDPYSESGSSEDYEEGEESDEPAEGEIYQEENNEEDNAGEEEAGEEEAGEEEADEENAGAEDA